MPAWRKARLSYGLVGLGLLILTAAGGETSEDTPRDYMPTSWYWRWTMEKNPIVVDQIRPQVIHRGSRFKPIELWRYVSGGEYDDSLLTWSAEPRSEPAAIQVVIDPRNQEASVDYQMDPVRHADSAEIRFRVRNPAGESAHMDVWFYILPVGEIIEDGEQDVIAERPVSKQDAMYPWGTTDNGRDVRAEMREAARGYLKFGIFSGFFGVLGAIVLASFAEWPSRPRIPFPTSATASIRYLQIGVRAFVEAADTVPKLVLLFGICLLISAEFSYLVVSVTFYNIFGCASLFRERISRFVGSDFYFYSLELGLSPQQVYFKHLLGQHLFPLLLTQIPAMIATYITWDCTLAVLGRAQAGKSWGHFLILETATPRFEFYLALSLLVLVTMALYFLGDTLREMAEER